MRTLGTLDPELEARRAKPHDKEVIKDQVQEATKGMGGKDIPNNNIGQLSPSQATAETTKSAGKGV